ncbi:MAG: pirin family protein [Gammaproteobacteria bacterium]|nr:pirin family protein [Gammaproteobacteria bacterium]
MISLRKAGERGHFNHGWLDTWHTFSFADYYDPEQMGFASLRVINEDRVAPGRGFAPHSHRDMEIITYILEGALEHKDSLGNGDAHGRASVAGGRRPGATSVIRPGDVQRMSAGTGVTHSEYNPSKTEPVHLLQIWIMPDKTGVVPSYEQKHYTEQERASRLRLIASADGRDGSVTIHQNASVYAALLGANNTLTHPLAPGRQAYIHVTRGALNVNGHLLSAGDGAKLAAEPEVRLSQAKQAEVLLFDLT